MTEDARDADAAWRDLVASYALPRPVGDVPVPWPDREDLHGREQRVPERHGPEREGPAPRGPNGEPGEDGAADGLPEAGQPVAGSGPVPGVIPVPPQPRIIRPAGQAPLPPAEDDEHFVPPVPPPLPRLDPVSKGAWLALFGGPGYLLLAVMAGWQIPGVAAFCAVAAFVGGFATLVMRMQDRPPGDSGPDDGAVV